MSGALAGERVAHPGHAVALPGQGPGGSGARPTCSNPDSPTVVFSVWGDKLEFVFVHSLRKVPESFLPGVRSY